MPASRHPLLSLLFGHDVSALPDRACAYVRAPLTDDDQVLQSHAHHWLRRIPSGAHPKQLCRYFPRIANCIAAHWHDPLATGHLLTELMVDRRGGRRGFPPRVAADIMGLHRLHARRLAHDAAAQGQGRVPTQEFGGRVPSAV
jgi:hypothetical protein